MGIRIVYFIANNDKSLLDNFKTAYTEFRNWTLSDFYDSELSEKGTLSMGQRISKKAIAYLEKCEILELDISSDLLDELIAVFIGSYCDHAKGRELYELTGPMMKSWRYVESTKLVDNKCDPFTKELWNRLNHGVSAKNNTIPSQAISKDIVIGWWTLEEIASMKIGLTKCFKNIDAFNDWIEMRFRGIFSPKKEIEGLEYVFEVFSIAISENKEVIFYTENE